MRKNSIYEFVLDGLNLEGKIILDAAIGQGNSTWFWAKAIHESGGNARILGIDNDLPLIWKDRITKNLGEYRKYVEIKEADIFNLGFLGNGSIDIINCADTLIFLNPTPLRLLSALEQFSRVLKPSGHLVITSELPLSLSAHSNETQYLRWNLSKAIFCLKGKSWATEIELDDLIRALNVTGFVVQNHRIFPESRYFAPESVDVVNEWREVMLQEINGLIWDSLSQCLIATVDKVYHQVLDDGYLLCPSKFVVKCVKSNCD